MSKSKLPERLLILKAGLNRSLNGDILFDRTAADTVMHDYSLHAVRDLPIDYGHAMLDNSAAKAAGWFKLDLLDGALWAVDIRWTEEASRMLKAGEVRYISPVIQTQPETGRVLRFLNFALTNLPAFDGMEPIMQFSVVPFVSGPVIEGDWDADAAVVRVAEWSGGDWTKYQQAFAWYDGEAAETLGAYKLPHHDVSEGNLVVSRGGVIACAAVLQGGRGGVDIPEADMAAVKDHIGSHYKDLEMVPPWEAEAVPEDEAEPEAPPPEPVAAAVEEKPNELIALMTKQLEAAKAVLKKYEFLLEHSKMFSQTALNGWTRTASYDALTEYVKTRDKATVHTMPPTRVLPSEEEKAVARQLGIDVKSMIENGRL